MLAFFNTHNMNGLHPGLPSYAKKNGDEKRRIQFFSGHLGAVEHQVSSVTHDFPGLGPRGLQRKRQKQQQ